MPRAGTEGPPAVGERRTGRGGGAVWGVVGGRKALTASELTDWMALWALEAEERKQAEIEAKQKGR